MEIEIKTQHGHKYRLQKQERKAHLSPQTLSKPQIDDLLRGAKPTKPSSWSALWNQVKPFSQKALNRDEDVLSALAKHILAGDVKLEKIDLIAAAKSSAGSTPGGSGSSAPVTLGAEVKDAPVANREIEAQQTEFSETEAASSEQPAKDKTQPASETETSGEPISMISGEELLPLVDAVLPGPMPFEWKRTYRSSLPRNIGMGCGWTHSGYEFIEITDTSAVYFDSEGREVPFALPKVKQRSKYIPERWNLDRVSENGFILRKEGEWDRVFTRPDASVKRFNLVQMRHPAYVAPTVVLGVTQAELGYCIHFSYNEQNKLTRIKGNWGKSLVLKRGKHALVDEVLLVNDRTKNTKLLAAYAYDEQQDLVDYKNAKGVGEQYRYENHLIVQRTLKTSFNFYFEWDGEDGSARCTHNWGDRGIYEYLFTWDPENNSSKTTDSRGYTTEYKYNEFGQIIEKIDNEGHTHRYKYSKGRRDAYIDPEGNATEYFYDKENNPVGYRDALGHSVSLGYFSGRLTTYIDKDKSTWRREYDRKGQLKVLRDPYNQSTAFTYNKHGLVASITDPMGRTTRYHWNEKTGELESIVDPMGHTRRFSYDEWGQLIASEFVPKGQNSGGSTVWDYGPTGMVENVTSPAGESTTYKYNDNDQLIKYIDHQGRTTEFVYDGLSQVVERIDAEGNRLRYEYDTERNLTALINEKGESHQFIYDANERLIKEIGFDGRVQNYKYNKAGHLIKHMDAGQVLTEFERDAMGRMLTKITKAKDANGKIVEERSRYQYDSKGRLVETYNAHHYLEFEYNRFGNLVKEHRSNLNAKRERQTSTMQDVRFSYIWPGIRSGITLPDGQEIDYQFNRNNLLTHVQFNGENIANIERDAFGREVARNQGQLRTETHYDPMGRLQKQSSYQQEQKSPGPVQREYGYDKFGNLSHITDGPVETRYIYNLVNRLTRVEGAHAESFDFDPAGNLLGFNGENLGKSAGNRLTMQGDRKFIYDARGNLIQENRGKEGKLETRFRYNLQNQLVKVEKEGQVTEYTYDPLGRRTSKQDKFGKTDYVWAGDQLIQETRNNIKKTYVYEPESFRPVAMVQDGEVYHYHLDHIGTPRELTSTEGKVVWKAQYRTYGNVAVKEVEEVENNLRFQGQYFDEETGLHYNRHRYYNPNTGQFISQDPIGLLGGVNCYQYVKNPIRWIDPLGLAAKPGDCGTATVYLWGNDQGNKHITVSTSHNGKTLHTHQVHDGNTFQSINGGKMQTWIIEHDEPEGKILKDTITIKLPNPGKAQEYQMSVLTDLESDNWKEMGWYDAANNSCMSHACDVLMAGGVDTRKNDSSSGRSTREGQKFLMSEKKKEG